MMNRKTGQVSRPVYAPRSQEPAVELRLELYFEQRTGAEEANVELHEEIYLSEDDGDGVLFRPRERKPHRRKLRNGGCDQNNAGFSRSKISAELNRRSLLIPDESKLRSRMSR